MALTKSDAEFSSERFRALVRDFKEESELLYRTLRQLCTEYPGHGEMKEVYAKVWLIGRGYATQIERKVKSENTPGSALSKVAKHILASGVEIDSLLRQLPDREERLTREVVQSILRVHGQFSNLLKSITSGHNARSFVSKYLHFHRPVVPIYDSVANASLTKLVRWHKDIDIQRVHPDEDDQYRWFVSRLLQLNERARAAGLDPTVRDLDWFLVGLAG
jgi:hypothetical protein